MDFETTILHYQTMQAAAEAMVKQQHPAVQWDEGEYLRGVLWDSDINVDVDGDTMLFGGGTWTNVLGGSQEPFNFSIPRDVFEKVVEARLAAMV